MFLITIIVALISNVVVTFIIVLIFIIIVIIFIIIIVVIGWFQRGWNSNRSEIFLLFGFWLRSIRYNRVSLYGHGKITTTIIILLLLLKGLG